MDELLVNGFTQEYNYDYIPGPGCEYEIPVLYFFPEDGWFEDEDNHPVPNIYDYITPDILHHFLHYKVCNLYEVKPGVFVELIFPDWIDCDDEVKLPWD